MAIPGGLLKGDGGRDQVGEDGGGKSDAGQNTLRFELVGWLPG